MAVDPSPEAVTRARASNHPIVLGDLSSETILEVVKPETARMAVLTLSDPVASIRIAEVMRDHHKEMPVLARAISNEHRLDLLQHGVKVALWPEFEAGLELTRQGLLTLHLPAPHEELRKELEDSGE